MQENVQLNTVTYSVETQQRAVDTIQHTAIHQEIPIQTDTVPSDEVIAAPVNHRPIADTIVPPVKKVIVQQPEVQNKVTVKDTVTIKKTEPQTEIYTLFRKGDTGYSHKNEPIWSVSIEHSPKHSFAEAVIHKFHRSQMNWTLVIAILCTVLLLIVRLNSKNLVKRVLNTSVNFQLADTMFRERNVITRRAFFMLNLIFIIVISLFTMMVARLFEFPTSGNSFHDYLIICSLIIGLLLGRYILYYLIGYIFEWLPAVSQQLHVSYLINKNLGLVLLPLVFSSIYLNPVLSKTVLFIGIGIIFFATLYKIIRGFQIIMRNGVLLFYAILYLCSLELLPILLGSKLIILLR